MVLRMSKIRLVMGERTWTTTAPPKITQSFLRQRGVRAILSTGKFEPSYSGPLLTRKAWTKLYDLLERILTDSIQSPPARAYIIENIAEIIKLLDLEEI